MVTKGERGGINYKCGINIYIIICKIDKQQVFTV